MAVDMNVNDVILKLKFTKCECLVNSKLENKMTKATIKIISNYSLFPNSVFSFMISGNAREGRSLKVFKVMEKKCSRY